MPPKYQKKEAVEAKADAQVAVEGEEKKGKGKGKGRGEGRKSALTKAQAEAQIVSLSTDDNEREATSKKISWILRKGAQRVNITMTNDGWVKLADVINAELLNDVSGKSEEKILAIIKESNEQKLRYETKDTDDGKQIRAIKREDRKVIEGKSPTKTVNDGALQPVEDKQTTLRADAKVFQPGAAGPEVAAGNYPAMGGYPGYGGYPFGYPWQAMMAAQAYGYGMPGAAHGAQAAAPVAADKRFTGRIKSYNTEKGYGFIESSDATAVYGRDVFLHKMHVGSFSVGSFVTFQVDINKQGMPQARELQGSDGKGVKGSKGKGKGKGEKKEKKPKGEAKGAKKEEGEAAGEAGEAKDSAQAADAAAPAADAAAQAAADTEKS